MRGIFLCEIKQTPYFCTVKHKTLQYMIKKFILLIALAITCLNTYADEPVIEIKPTKGSGSVRRAPAPKRLGQSMFTVAFEEGVLNISSLCEVGVVSILISNVQTSEEIEYITNFSESGTECVLELSEGEYEIEIEGGGISWQCRI